MKKTPEELLKLLLKTDLEDAKNLLDISNEYLEKFINCIDPRKYDDARELFVQTCLTGPSMIASSIIDKVAGTFHLDRDEILNQYIEKLNLALRWVDHKKE